MFELFLTALLWGFSYGINGMAMEFATATAMSLLFGVIGTFLFAPFAANGSSVGLRGRCMVAGAVQFGIMYYFYQSAFIHLESHQVALLGLVTPIYVGLFADLLGRRNPWQNLFFALGAVSIAAFSFGGTSLGACNFRGAMECQLANGAYALGQVLYARLKQSHPELADRSALFWMYLGSLPPLLVASALIPAVTPAQPFLWQGKQLAILLFLGIFCSGIGNYLWNRGIGRVSAGILLIANNLPILFGVLFGIFLFGESGNGWRQIFGVGGLLSLLWLHSRVRPIADGRK
ncbi:MAG: DMT family transporter [Puniceicoccales bacterium]|nr:DMT family transporter [Puniceicoccales bacterium]